jgi:hypothetical protein
MDGVNNGFHIVDAPSIPPDYIVMDNYRSATCPSARDKVAAQIKKELDLGHYKIAVEQPRIISALGAIPKKLSDDYRLITDASRPPGNAINDYATLTPFKFRGLQEAIDMIQPGYYLMKLDLSSAYRVVKVHPSNYIATGLKFRLNGDDTETVMVDTRLPFGASRSVGIFNMLSTAVCDVMKDKYGMPILCLILMISS